MLLLATIKLKDNAYAVFVRDLVKEWTQKHIEIEIICDSFDKLVKNGYVTAVESKPPSDEEENGNFLYSITPLGETEMKKSKNFKILG